MFNYAKIWYFGIDIKPNIEKAIELLQDQSQDCFFYSKLLLFHFYINDSESYVSKILKIFNENLYIEITKKINNYAFNYLKKLDLVYEVDHNQFFSNEMQKKLLFIILNSFQMFTKL